jgi:hypothetical protein
MAADMAHENLDTQYPETSEHPELGMVIPLPRREPETESLDDSERLMLNAFYGYALTAEGIDPRALESSQLPKASHAAHEFLFTTSERHAAAHAPADPKAAPHVFTMPKPPVERRIKEYYQQFGTSRRTKSPRLLEPEEKYIAQKRQQLEVYVYGDGGDSDGAGALTPIKKIAARAAPYPEITLGLRLEEALRKDGQQLAADAVDVVLSAYGARLSDIRIQELGRRGVIRVTESSMIRQPDLNNIPEELQAENYRPR